ncbi:hypothetical protein RIF29_00350 [Crotalaria pallida]|uniref:Uncharacterized protein n=1 Tax=Crotalaria pallida TaxID=3830 RepID=A0AAN9IXE9_CROPI
MVPLLVPKIMLYPPSPVPVFEDAKSPNCLIPTNKLHRLQSIMCHQPENECALELKPDSRFVCEEGKSHVDPSGHHIPF